MDYQYYRRLGAGIIGSGAIEAAHRCLIKTGTTPLVNLTNGKSLQGAPFIVEAIRLCGL